MAKRRALVAVPRSRAIAGWLSLSFLIPFALLIALFTLKVPLGQGYFIYRYSPARDQRAIAAVYALPLGGVACAAVWMLAQRSVARRRIGLALLALAAIGAGAWGWLAPPQAMTQHFFNFTSPSNDGA